MEKQKEKIELDSLLMAYRTSKDEKKKRMFHLEIVENSMNLVKKIAVSISANSGIAIEDLIQVGSIGLIKAIRAFDADKPAKFTTYATHFIKGEIRHYLRDKASLIKPPRELQEMLFKINTEIYKLKEMGIEEPTIEQIAEKTGVDTVKILEILEIEHHKSALSLDQSFFSEDEDSSLIDKIPSGDYQEFLNSHEDKMMIVSAIKRLPADLQKVIELSYYDDLNQREISEKLQISQMQVSRRLKKALNRMYELIKIKE